MIPDHDRIRERARADTAVREFEGVTRKNRFGSCEIMTLLWTRAAIGAKGYTGTGTQRRNNQFWLEGG